jgi:hypothetical protein
MASLFRMISNASAAVPFLTMGADRSHPSKSTCKKTVYF